MTQGDEEAIAQIMAYLEQHHREINIYALRKQLIAAGHPRLLVDEAMRRFSGGPATPKLSAWPAGLAIMLLNLVLIYPAFFLVTVISGNSVDLAWLPLLGLGLLYLAELVVGLRLRGGLRDFLGRALVWGVSFTAIAFALVALLFGICIAIIYSL